MEKGEGMSMAEFFYPVLQAWDWWHLYSTEGIQLQIGGADQFGNILAGADAINYVRKTKYDASFEQESAREAEVLSLRRTPVGFTVPLLTTASGEKFGKSAGNAIWLDGEMTSAFDLYQVWHCQTHPLGMSLLTLLDKYFLGTADADVHHYLKRFTFEPLQDLDTVMRKHEINPSRRFAQHKLAIEVLSLVHGQETAERTQEEHLQLFSQRPRNLPQINYEHSSIASPSSDPSSVTPDSQILSPAALPPPSLTLPRSLIQNVPFPKLLYHATLVPSKSEGHRTCTNGAAYVGSIGFDKQLMFTRYDNDSGDEKGNQAVSSGCEKYVINGDTLVLRVGKRKVKVVKVVDDAEILAGKGAGEHFPGATEWVNEM